MKLNSALPTFHLGTRGKGALVSLLLSAALIALFVPLSGDFAHAASGASTFDDVQVTIQTSSTLPDYYSVSAYNMTGGLVASYDSQYPAAAFELPTGAYIFTATATQQQSGPIPVIVANGTMAPGTSGPLVAGQPVKCCTPPAMCCYVYTPPAVEYGYASQQISGPTSLTISTNGINQTSTSTLAIKVSYPNGTAASGAYVSASVLGDNYGWAYGSSALSMSNTTNADGVATLITPTAPVLVSASASIPIVLPLNQTTFQVTVGGVKVNVTANWEPEQVSFAGQALIVPPQTSASIVLQYQPQYPGPIAYASTQTGTASATASSGSPGGVAQTTSEEQLPGLQVPVAATQTTPSNSGVSLLAGVAAAISIVALGVALFAVRARLKPFVQ